jgi:hypothetical protein
MTKPAIYNAYLAQQILRTFMRFIGAVMAGVTTGMCVLLASMLFRAAPAFATSVLPISPPKVLVAPLIDLPNVPRKIVVSGTWPNGCGPVGVTLDSRDTSQTGILVIRARFDATGPICTQVVTSYRFEVDYTPAEAGVLRVVVTSDIGAINGEGNVITAQSGKTHSALDISGVWYDPATNGSGLTFQHDFRGNDVAFGTWYLYDQAGGARWYTIQNVVWSADGKGFEAQLLESRSPPVACPSTNCPALSTASNRIGTVRMTLTGDEFVPASPIVMKLDVVSLANTPLFSSSVRRINF